MAGFVRKPDAPALLVTAAAFGALAVFGLGCALLANSSARVLYSPYATIVLPASPRALQLLTAVASAVSAVAYGALLHRFAQSVNRTLIVVQFVLFTIGTAVIALTVASLNSALMALKQENVTVFVVWHLRILWLGGLSVGLGCLAFAVNVGRALMKVFLRSSN